MDTGLDSDRKLNLTTSLEPKYQTILESLQHHLNIHTNARVDVINFTERYLMWGAHPSDKKTEGEILKAARTYAVERVLGHDYLKKIDPWDDQAVTSIVGYLRSNYEDELRIWIGHKDRLKLDPERVERVEKAVKSVFGVDKEGT